MNINKYYEHVKKIERKKEFIQNLSYVDKLRLYFYLFDIFDKKIIEILQPFILENYANEILKTCIREKYEFSKSLDILCFLIDFKLVKNKTMFYVVNDCFFQYKNYCCIFYKNAETLLNKIINFYTNHKFMNALVITETKKNMIHYTTIEKIKKYDEKINMCIFIETIKHEDTNISKVFNNLKYHIAKFL